MRRSIYLILIYSIAVLVFFLIIYRQIIFWLTDKILVEPFLAASILISLAAIMIRLFILDPAKFSSAIHESDVYKSDQLLKTTRFLNIMPIAMVICTVADFLLPIDFVIGMLTFLLAQILYITAYSGIVHIHPRILFSEKTKTLAIVSTLAWIILPALLYFLLIFNPSDTMTLVVIPYVVVLCLMCLITFFAFGYPDRPITFRIMLAGGATCFFISDAILAIERFNASITIPMGALVIGATYLLATFMLHYSVLLLRSPMGDSIKRAH